MSDLVLYITVGGLKMRDLDFIEKNSENWLKIKDVKYELSGIQLKKNEYMYVEFILKEVIDEMKNIKLNDWKINPIIRFRYSAAFVSLKSLISTLFR